MPPTLPTLPPGALDRIRTAARRVATAVQQWLRRTGLHRYASTDPLTVGELRRLRRAALPAAATRRAERRRLARLARAAA